MFDHIYKNIIVLIVTYLALNIKVRQIIKLGTIQRVEGLVAGMEELTIISPNEINLFSFTSKELTINKS